MKDWPKALSVVAVSLASLCGAWLTNDPNALWGLAAAVLIVVNW